MALAFTLIDDHKCDGCARKIRKCVEKLQGVQSAKVSKTLDQNGNDDFTLLVVGSFDPERIIKEVEKNTKKKIDLIPDINHGKPSEVEPLKVNVEKLKKLKKLASNNLGKEQRLTGLENECETLKAQLNSAWARRNELARQKREILDCNLPSVSIPPRSRGREVKKKDESEMLYGKLASKELKVEDFVKNYKELRVKKYKQLFNG